MSRLPLLLSLLLLSGLATAQEYTFKRTLKVGDTFKYRLKADLEFVGNGKATMTGVSTEKITKVEESGNYTVESTSSEGRVEAEGMDPTEVPAQPILTSIFRANGDLLELKRDKVRSDDYRISNMNVFRAPDKAVKIGDSWTRDVQPDTKTGMVAAKATFVVESVDKVGIFDAVKIKYGYIEATEENPSTAEGYFWINPSDGSLIKSDLTIKNAPFPNAPFKIHANIVVTRE